VSAAVIGENPRLFGFQFNNPLGFVVQAVAARQTKVILAEEFSRGGGTAFAVTLPLRVRLEHRTVTFPEGPEQCPRLRFLERRRPGRGSVVATCFVNAFTTRKSSEGEVQHA
jgi:hypothetical protein